MSATDKYVAAIEALKSFGEEEAGVDVDIFTERYPMRIVITPNMNSRQVSIDTTPEEDEGKLVITLGLKTSIENTLKFSIDAATLKKLLRLAEKTSILYYHSFCELQKGPQTLEEAAR